MPNQPDNKSDNPSEGNFVELQQRSVAEQLVDRLRDGDDQALAELFSLYRDRLLRLVNVRLDRRLHSRVDPSDILQDSYLDAASRVEHFFSREDASIAVWLRLIVLQRIQMVVRHHLLTGKRDARKEISLGSNNLSNSYDGMVDYLADSLTSASVVVARAEAVSMVETMLAEMSETDREILVLRHFEQVPNDEAAEILGITVKAASNRYVRALGRLRELIERVEQREQASAPRLEPGANET